MKQILNIGGPQLQLNALFIQPTRWCGLNCKGCYVKAHHGGEDGYHTPWNEQLNLFRLFYNSQQAWANQITISVDDLHKDPAKKAHMVNLIGWISHEIGRPYHGDRPEVHMTMHTPRTWYQYIDNNVCIGEGLSMVSFSELPEHLPETNQVLAHFSELGIPVNYNKLIPTYKSGMDWDKEADKLTAIARKVDHIYLVIYKRPIGLAPKTLISQADTDRMTSDIVYLQNILKRVPGDVRAKITTDGCLRDTIQSKTTGFGCSSGVSRFQVWPDGTVSGCAYAFSGSGKIGKFAEDILDNIRLARGKYEFQESCHLPTVYSSIPGLGQAK